MNKKILTTLVGILLAAGMTAGTLTGCSNNQNSNTPESGKESSTVSETSKETDAATKAEATAKATEAVTEPQETEPSLSEVTIGSADELFAFIDEMNNGTDYSAYTIKFTADIDLAGKDWTPIDPFNLNDAVIDGQGHTISNMTINAEGSSLGFVGLVDADTWISIKNLTFKDATLNATGRHNGIVIGEINGGYASVEQVQVLNCTINGATGNDVHDDEEGDLGNLSIREAGIAGMVQNGGSIDIIGCTVDGLSVTGFHNLAGLIGYLEPGQTTVRNNVVKNVVLNFSAGYSSSNYYHDDDAEAVASGGKLGRGRRYTNVFYNLEGWIDHEEDDKTEGNTYENITIRDLAGGVEYKDFEDPCYSPME